MQNPFYYYRTRKLTSGTSSAIAEYKKKVLHKRISFIEVACPNCHRNYARTLYKVERHGIPWQTVLCRYCGMMYSNPQMDEESTKHFYESDLYRRLHNQGQALSTSQLVNRYRRPNNIFNFVSKAKIEYQTVAEIGSAGGWNLKAFQNDGKSVTGYELSEQLVEMANNFFHVPTKQAAVLGSPYDLVILSHVLEHFGDPVFELKWLAENDCEYLYIQVPGLLHNIPSIQNAHNHYFSLANLVSIIGQSGYQIVTHGFINNDIQLLAKLTMRRLAPIAMPSEYERVMKLVRKHRLSMFRGLFHDIFRF